MQLLEVTAPRQASRMTIAWANPANPFDVGAATATRLLLDPPKDPAHVADTKPSSLNQVPLDLPKNPVPAAGAQLSLLDPVVLVDVPKAPGHAAGAQLSLLDPSLLCWLKGLAHAVAGTCLQHVVILRRTR
ncbi:hypothetical protein PHYSODRAFT_305144 [Phytophthora sojae]|uniref:Uncharacterized protein n=1 Tax=Phytophthora sojae (strain P6497) TaxID=1094619 RepID=G5A4W4_PHYSP|nr:hypothetical protein PHYSODRAFT_305144 [Phytophthora sojae]EGZ09713.1 hypothetical protein PHYSODRAFT_305144 [Phytophthora sojae]|eukprot:XP_009534574.1 hypothetical protein PHYSODRAFT_305144 [Phytophthora sojae]